MVPILELDDTGALVIGHRTLAITDTKCTVALSQHATALLDGTEPFRAAGVSKQSVSRLTLKTSYGMFLD